ncbi:stonustoxin subunit alpha-like [Micropterus salmoides]|uniref:stonustoxin subunit alpha-like n=1 Tax=Micropterus salmoides TaxID=27706 RepID=UPI0018EB4D6F|nr:stonustoxin subunit alpha-like [Micropterus salmoides]
MCWSDPPPPFRVEPAGVQWLRPGLRKYSCELTIDTNTVNRWIILSDNNRKATRVMEDQSYPDHPDRFDKFHQVLCREGLTGRCYWEVEWRGSVSISVSYRRIKRRGGREDCEFGWNYQSWNLICSDVGGRYGYNVRHNKRGTDIISSSSYSSSTVSHKVAVYVDCPAGSLSFYRVSSDTLIHLHTFNTTFTEPLYPGFGVFWSASSVSLAVSQYRVR